MAKSSGLFLATIYNQSQLAERKHVARYWSINTAATAVSSAHPSPLVITTKLEAAILGGGDFGWGVLPAQYCPCGLTLFSNLSPLIRQTINNALPCACTPAAKKLSMSMVSCAIIMAESIHGLALWHGAGPVPLKGTACLRLFLQGSGLTL